MKHCTVCQHTYAPGRDHCPVCGNGIAVRHALWLPSGQTLGAYASPAPGAAQRTTIGVPYGATREGIVTRSTGGSRSSLGTSTMDEA